MNEHKILAGVALILVFAVAILVPYVGASGVAMPYWTGEPGSDHPLIMQKGSSQTVNIELQNGLGDSSTSFKVSVESAGGVARLTDSDGIYEVAAGTSEQVPIEISVPVSASDGDSYRVRVSVQEVKGGTPGQFTLSSAFESSFDVIVGQPIQSSPTPSSSGDRTLIYVIVALVVLVGLIIFFRNRKN